MDVNKVLELFAKPDRKDDYAVHFVEMSDGRKAVWKPEVGNGIVSLKEVLAYTIDRWMDIGVIPQTEFYYFDGRLGSIQLWVDGTIGTEALRNSSPLVALPSAQRLGVFHYIANNVDRGHWL